MQSDRKPIRQRPGLVRARVLLVAALAVVIAAPQLRGEFRVGLVLPFQNNTRDATLDWISESFAETLSSELASPRFLMIDRRERASAFDTLGVPQASILSNATIYKLADSLDADQAVIGTYEYAEGVFAAKAQVLDMNGPRLSPTFTESGPLATLLDIQRGLAWQLQKYLRPNYPLSREEFLAQRKAPRLDAFENYIRGLLSKDKAQQIRYFRTALRLDPIYTKPAFELGMLHFQNRDYSTSALWLSKLRREDPEYLEANFFLGLAYLHQQRYEASAAAFRVVEQQLPLNEVYNNLGIALARQDRPGALQYFEKAVQSSPADPDYQFNLAFAHWKRNNYAEAAAHLAKALEVNNSPVWRALYVECLRKSGRPEEAARQAALLPAPWASGSVQFTNLEVPKDTYVGYSFRQLRRLLQLQEELKHAKLTAREHGEVHYQAALEALKAGAEREAVEELELVIDFDPQHAGAYLELANIHQKAGRLDEAARMADRAVDLDPTAEGYLVRARILAAQGKAEAAVSALEEALSLDPSNAAAASLRAELGAQTSPR